MKAVPRVPTPSVNSVINAVTPDSPSTSSSTASTRDIAQPPLFPRQARTASVNVEVRVRCIESRSSTATAKAGSRQISVTHQAAAPHRGSTGVMAVRQTDTAHTSCSIVSRARFSPSMRDASKLIGSSCPSGAWGRPPAAGHPQRSARCASAASTTAHG